MRAVGLSLNDGVRASLRLSSLVEAGGKAKERRREAVGRTKPELSRYRHRSLRNHPREPIDLKQQMDGPGSLNIRKISSF